MIFILICLRPLILLMLRLYLKTASPYTDLMCD